MSGNSVITRDAAESLQLGKHGSYSNEGNVLQHVLFDVLDFNDAAVRAEGAFFQKPIGSTYMGGSKTNAQTNLFDAGKLPNTQTFLVKDMSIGLIASVAGADTDAKAIVAAFTNIMQASKFELKIAGREYDLQVPGSVFLPSVFVHGADVAGDGANIGGSLISTGWIKLNATPVVIGNMVTFSVNMSTSTASAALLAILNTASDILNTQNAQIQCRLRGVLTRSI
jgi:hypothetical protein